MLVQAASLSPCPDPLQCAKHLPPCSLQQNPEFREVLQSHMLKHLTPTALAAVRGACTAFQQLVNHASADGLQCLQQLLPTGIAKHASRGHEILQMLSTQHALIARLRCGCSRKIVHVPTFEDCCALDLVWSPGQSTSRLVMRMSTPPQLASSDSASEEEGSEVEDTASQYAPELVLLDLVTMVPSTLLSGCPIQGWASWCIDSQHFCIESCHLKVGHLRRQISGSLHSGYSSVFWGSSSLCKGEQPAELWRFHAMPGKWSAAGD